MTHQENPSDTGITAPMNQKEAYRILADRRVLVDPADRRSTIEIATALLMGDVSLAPSEEVSEQGTQMPALDYHHGIPTLRSESSRRNNMF